MEYVQVDKTKLVNLEYTLSREILRTNRSGAYSSSTIVGCNTRKYHGLLVCPISDDSTERYVMLSSMQCSVIQHDKIFNLGIQEYGDSHFEPKGHKYLFDFETNPIPKHTFRVGGVQLSQEILLSANEHQVLLRYTLLEAHSATKLRLKPFLAFRNIHELTRQNMEADTHYTEIQNGIKIKLYKQLPELHIQCNKKAEYVPVPDWYHDVEYRKELERGYLHKEDLYVPGYFEVEIEKGESIIFAAGLNEAATNGLKAKFTRELKARTPRCTMKNNLINAAQQFLVERNNKVTINAGYHWYKEQLRDTLIALPGLTIYQDNKKSFTQILETSIETIRNKYLLANRDKLALEDAGNPLWLFHTLHHCKIVCGDSNFIMRFFPMLNDILLFYKNGVPNQLRLLDNGLVYVKREGYALTWMNAMAQGKPVTPRYGSPVEINALWYNAIGMMLDMAEKLNNKEFIKEWTPFHEKLKEAFNDTYWYAEKGCLYDVVDLDKKDKSMRPNQIIAAGLPFSPLDKEQKKSVIDAVTKELYTPKGLRTLSPQDVQYKGVVEGDEHERGRALHQGAVYPWLAAFLADAHLSISNKGALSFLNNMVDEFKNEMTHHCLGTISECYNGNPPHQAKGAVSMAWNVAAVLRMLNMTETNS